MTNESNLLVTFSKRRTGLFKKASELCTLCGVKIAIIVFSPGQKNVFSFGHPNLELVIDKFITPHDSNPDADSGVLQFVDPELNGRLSMLQDQFESQTTRGDIFENERRQRQVVDWFEAPIEHLGFEQLQMMKYGLTELKKMVVNRRNGFSVMQEVQDLNNWRFEGGEQADDPCVALGITMTPQGYALL
ncbi:hypothetical protein AgCh_017640 [Apium graveolens]